MTTANVWAAGNIKKSKCYVYNCGQAVSGFIPAAIVALGITLSGCGLDGIFNDDCKPGEICEGDKPFENNQVFTAQELLDRYFPAIDQVTFTDTASSAAVTSTGFGPQLRVQGAFVPGSQAANPNSAQLASASLSPRQDATNPMILKNDSADPGSWAATVNTMDYILEQYPGEYILTLSIQAKHGENDIVVGYQYDPNRSEEFYLVSARCITVGSCVEGMNESGNAESELMSGIVSDIPLITLYLEETNPDVSARINSVVRNGQWANINFTIFNNSPVPLNAGVRYSAWANRTSPPVPGSSSGNFSDSGNIPANGQVTIDFTAPGYTLGIENTAYIVVDDNSVIDESNEDNNVASFAWTP